MADGAAGGTRERAAGAPALSIVIPYYKRFDGLILAVRSALALARQYADRLQDPHRSGVPQAGFSGEDLPQAGLSQSGLPQKDLRKDDPLGDDPLGEDPLEKTLLAGGAVEVITVNDGSGAEPDWPADLAGPAVLHLSLDRNSGACIARNTGLARARGRYVIFLDSDDVLVPEGVLACLDLLERRADLVGAGGALRLVRDAPGRPPAGIRAVARPTSYRNADTLFALNQIGPLSKMVFRRQAVLRAGGFDESLVSCQDWDLYVELAAFGSLALLPRTSAIYLVGQDSITGNLDKGMAGRRSLLAKNAARPAWWRAVFLANALVFFVRRRRPGLTLALIAGIRPWPRRAGLTALLVPATGYFLARKLVAALARPVLRRAVRNPYSPPSADPAHPPHPRS